MDYLTIRIPKNLIRFAALFYGVWCVSLWAALMGLSVFILNHKDPFWNPLWQPKTANASMAALCLFAVGGGSVVFGFFRMLHHTKNQPRLTVVLAALFSVCLPAIALLSSAGLLLVFLKI